MRHRTSIIITWGGLLILLWAATFLSVRWVIGAHTRSTDDARARQTLLNLHGASAQRMQRMRQGCRLMMTAPELRALTGEARGGVSEENIGTLTGRLNALRTLVDASCVCVLDGNAAAVAQNSGSPWGSLEELRSFLQHSPQASAMIASVFAAAMNATPDQPPPEVWGVWSSGRELYQVIGMPLVSSVGVGDDAVGGEGAAGSRADGALITATRVGDDFARSLSRGAGCDVTFLASGRVAASSLPAEVRPMIGRLGDAGAGGSDLSEPFEMTMSGVPYRALMRPVIDPCSGTGVGAVMVQSDLTASRALERSITLVFMLLLTGGLASGAIALRVSGAQSNRRANATAGIASVRAASAAPALRLMPSAGSAGSPTDARAVPPSPARNKTAA